jgi:putative transposase
VYDGLKGLSWSWLSLDEAMTKAPLTGRKKVGLNLTDRGKQGVKRSLLSEAAGLPVSLVIDGINRHDMKLAQNTL